jgi:2'-hydroxyisoflavone reductase
MRILVLGGTGFLGRAVVAEALRRAGSVTTFNRGRSPLSDPRVTELVGDRLVAADLAPLADGHWDVVVDTWAGAPRAAATSAALLAAHADRYVYVSSGSVYAPSPRIGGDESAPTVDASPVADDGEYPARKRGAELAVEAAFGERAILARAGLILGPYEDVGRLPWWLLRLDRGGEVLAPGPPELELQYIDARDAAAWMLDVAAAGGSGAYNMVSRTGHATMGSLLEAGLRATGGDRHGDTRLTWVDPAFLDDRGIEAWTELPIWLPAEHEYRGMHHADVSRAHAAGLRCRPLTDTVADTWAWLLSVGKAPARRSDLPAPGLDPARERAALAAWHAGA